ncbi:MAG: SDR family oxidoreductase [Acidobacteria bacterium]|nr:SDR family oxidoreductase [Acidobacteriota bacterium]
MDATQTLSQHSILLTGANGFVGKVLLGLVLDRFPEARHLYILMRSKRTVSAAERFESEVLTSPPLRDIVARRGLQPVRRTITILEGDISQSACGLRADDIARLEGVSLIINCAGLVEFLPPVTEAFQTNVDGVEHVIELAKRLGAKLLHVSTCFVCGEGDGLVEETEPVLGFYPGRKGPDDTSFDHRREIAWCRERARRIIEDTQLAGEAPDSRAVAQRLIDLGSQRAKQWGWVNTYTYSKSLGEQLIASEPGLEFTLVRPAIVESALEFPFPGWVEGGRTAAPLVSMAMSGMRDWTVRPDIPLEVVPVDFIAAAILIAGVLLLNGQHAPIYQLGTADTNPILLGPLVELLHDAYRSANGKRIPRRARVHSARAYHKRRLRLQKQLRGAQSMALVLRKFLRARHLPGQGGASKLATLLRALELQASFREQMLELYQPFILDNRYIFESENIRAARALLCERDRGLLPWAPERINWRSYWVDNEIRGVQKWVEPEAMKSWSFKV